MMTTRTTILRKSRAVTRFDLGRCGRAVIERASHEKAVGRSRTSPVWTLDDRPAITACHELVVSALGLLAVGDAGRSGRRRRDEWARRRVGPLAVSAKRGRDRQRRLAEDRRDGRRREFAKSFRKTADRRTRTRARRRHRHRPCHHRPCHHRPAGRRAPASRLGRERHGRRTDRPGRQQVFGHAAEQVQGRPDPFLCRSVRRRVPRRRLRMSEKSSEFHVTYDTM